MRIFKYAAPLSEIDDFVEVEMPTEAKIVSVINQRETLAIYAQVFDYDSTKQVRRFRVAGTGHPIDDLGVNARFLGTVSFRGGGLVFHVWEV